VELILLLRPNGNAIAVTSAPTATATSSLIQLGGTISGGNTSTNGGTYLGINEPSSGAGSAADFLDLQANNSIKLQLTSGGLLALDGAAATGSFALNAAGNINVTTGNAFEINGASLNTAGTLSNVAYLNATSQTFTGNQIIQGSSGITLGVAGSVVGNLVFNDGVGGGTHTVTLAGPATADPTSSYTLNLPTTAPTASQCLQSGASTASQLTFGSCGSGSGVTTVGTFSGSSQVNGASISGNTITFGPASTTNPGEVSTGTQTFAGAKTIQSTSTTAFQVQNTGGSSTLLTADTTNMRLGVDVTYAAIAAPAGLSATAAGSGSGSLTNGTTYYYKVTAIDSAAGETPFSTEAHVAATTTGTINLSWTSVCGASGYKVYRGTATNGETGYYTTIGTTSGAFTCGTSTVSFSDVGALQANTTATAPNTTAAYAATNTSTNSLQLSIGGNGTPTSQLYVSGEENFAGAVSTGTGSKPQTVYVQGRYAYVVDNGTNLLAIYDVSNPSSPTLVSSVSTGTSSAPYSVYVQGRYAYVADFGTNLLAIYDVSNPSSPTLVSSVSTGTSSTPNDVYVSGSYAYVTGAGSNTLTIYNVSNSVAPVQVGNITVTGTNPQPQEVFVSGRYAYVTAANVQTLDVYDISDPAAPVLAGSASTGSGSYPCDVYVQGNYAYVNNAGSSDHYMYIYSITNPSSPTLVGDAYTGTFSYETAIFAQGRYVYDLDYGDGVMDTFDVSNPDSPVQVTVFNFPYSTGDLSNLYVSGRYAYVLDSKDAIFNVVDLGGAYIQQLQAGGTETGTLQVDSNAAIGGDATVQGGFQVGQSLQVDGNVGIDGSVNNGGPVTDQDTELIQDAGAGTNALTVDNNLGIPIITAGSNNLLVNGDFESGTTGWAANGTGASIVQSSNPAYAYSGSNSLAVTVGTTATVGAQVTTFNNAMTPGTYVLSFYAKAATAFSTLAVTITGGSATCTLNSNSVSVSAFTEYSCTFTSTSTNITAITIEDGTNTTALTFYVDAVQLVSNTNLISNPGFETGTIGWSAGTGVSIALNQARNYVYFGQSSLQVTTGTTANNGAQDSTFIVPGTQLVAGAYTLSFFAEGTTAWTTLQASLGTGTCMLNSTTLSTTGFQQYWCTVTTAASPTIEIGSSGTTANLVMYVDDVQLTTGSTLQAYNIGQIQLRGIIDNPVIFQGTSNSTLAFQIQNSSSTNLFSVDTLDNKVIIGSPTTDTTQVLLQLDSFSTFADTATCTTTTNQGALYYNTSSNSVRGCVNGSWQDLVSSDLLNAILFGVVPDSGSVDPGDLAGVTGLTDGPCKVFVGATTAEISWNSCEAYSGGRKVYVTAGSNVATTNSTAGDFQHLCLTGSGNQPALSTAAAETGNLATVSMPSTTAPILCLADIKFAAANNTITDIYDTRTFTTSQKEFTTAITNNPVLGAIVIAGTTTPGAVVPAATLQTGGIMGVVVASTGATSTSTVNVMIATSGPAWVKAITETGNAVGGTIQTTATAGYAGDFTTPATTAVYSVLGLSQTAWTGATACAASSNACAGSVLTFVNPR
jgi:hypothetical protein